MSRKNISGSRTKVLEIPRFNGLNTASSFSEIDITQSPRMLNGIPNKRGGLSKRPGSRPLSVNPLAHPIETLAFLRFNNIKRRVVGSNKKLYHFLNGNFVEEDMQVPLNSSDFDWTQFKDGQSREVLVIADGANLKQYDGTKVSEIVPAPNDESPLPANDLATINSKHKPTGCLVHNTRVVLWNNTDTIWHSKIGYYDYYPKTDYHRFVRENDYVQTCVSYRGALLVFMRRHIGVLFGHDIENWQQDFLDTNEGCISPKTVQTVTYPDGKQEVFYVSDTGVHSVYAIDTQTLDSSARYSTKNVSSKSIDWKALGVTPEVLEKSVAVFHDGKYWLIYKKDQEYHGLVFDTENEQWYPINNIKATDFMSEGYLYFTTESGHFMYLDDSIYTDWEDYNQTNGKPVDFYWHSKLMTPKLTGHDHLWDILMVEAKYFQVPSTLDVEVNTQRKEQFSVPSGIITAVMVWGKTKFGEAEWANPNLTSFLNNPNRLRTFLKGGFAQVKLSNNRNEPVELYGLRYEVRVMDTYY